MMILNKDGTLLQNSQGTRGDTSSSMLLRRSGERSYAVAVLAQSLDEQGALLDQLIGLAFDLYRALHLEVRVYDAER